MYRELLRSAGLLSVFTAVSFLTSLLLSIEWPTFAQSGVTLQSIVPNKALAGSGPVTVTLNGANFDSASTVFICCQDMNGAVTVAPTFIDTNTLKAVIPASLLVSPKTAYVSVMNPGTGHSEQVVFYVMSSSPPLVWSMIPAGGIRGTTIRLRLAGTNVAGATLSFSGSGITAQEPPFGGFVDVTIAPEAPLGPQAVTISTLGGATTVCNSQPCIFSVVESGSWSEVPAPAVIPGIVLRLLDGRVLMAGGRTATSVPIDSAQIFDPSTGRWTATGSMNRARAGGGASLLPDGRVLVTGSASPEIYNPVAGTWSNTGPMSAPGGQALLLPNGKVLVVAGNFAADLFDPVTGLFQPARGVAYTSGGVSSMELLSDGRVLIISRGVNPGEDTKNRIYDPVTETLSEAPALRLGFGAYPTRLLPDGRVLVRGFDVFGPFSVISFSYIYDPGTNTVLPASIDGFGPDVLLPNGMVLISGLRPVRRGMAGTDIIGYTVLYNAATDQMLPQPSATPPAEPTTLLEDGLAFGISYYAASLINGTFAQVYTPPPFTNPVPVIGSVVSNSPPSNADPISLDIHGSSFLANSFVQLGSTKLVTLYLGSKRLVAFVPPALRSSLSSGVTVNNPVPGGGRTDAVRIGFRGTVPLRIDEVETGAIRTGYVIITPDASATAPTSTLTYGMVRDGIVQSQAAILPAPLTTETSIIVDVVQAIGRNLGIAIANGSATPASITVTLRDPDGSPASPTVSFSIPTHRQVARFVTELFPSGTIGAAFAGSVTIQSSIPVSITGLRFSGVEFSTVPVPVMGSASIPQQGPIGGTNAVMFPQFAMSGGWATTLGLVNTGATRISGRVDIFDTDGNPLTVTLNGERKSTFNYAIPAHGSLILAPRDANGQSPF